MITDPAEIKSAPVHQIDHRRARIGHHIHHGVAGKIVACRHHEYMPAGVFEAVDKVRQLSHLVNLRMHIVDMQNDHIGRPLAVAGLRLDPAAVYYWYGKDQEKIVFHFWRFSPKNKDICSESTFRAFGDGSRYFTEN
jgi:hypothetical protein